MLEVETDNAAEHFFPNPSFAQIYSEAVTNALDAGATNVVVSVAIREFLAPDTLRLTIADNGDGFTDENFERFKRLLKPRDEMHKGLGRLIYLRYFTEVDVSSGFGTILRRFRFQSDFTPRDELPKGTHAGPNQTKLTFKHFKNQRLKSYDDLRPKAIKERLMIELLPRLYEAQKQKKDLRIEIELTAEVGNPDRDFMNDKQVITLDQLPKLDEQVFSDPEIDLLQEITMAYTIESGFGKNTVFTVACVDDRTIDLKLIPDGSLPNNHSAIFLFYSPFFKGKADPARQKLNIEDAAVERALFRCLRRHVAATIASLIPAVVKKNEEVKTEFEEKFPHLLGYFEGETVGLIQKDEAIEMAQRRFFRDQKSILESDKLDDANFARSIDISSRTLTEYILYRNLIIQKLREFDEDDEEAAIHSLIVPRFKTFRGSEFMKGVYSNNAWLLDDKFMTFTTILSEAQMDKVITEITLKDDIEADLGRPDISMIFSADPNTNQSVDVVVVELKKKTDDEKENSYAVNQLLQRAEKLAATCPNIQRIWYYAILQVNDTLKRRFRQQEWTPLFSKGTVFYKEHKTEAPDGAIIPTPTFVLSFDSIIDDAAARNSTFLNILREDLKSRVSNQVEDKPVALMKGQPPGTP
jgi:hypothetical protein